MRSKWKGSQELREKLAIQGGEELNEEREPVLDGFTPDYDLKLFREAQALAAIKIEEELGDIMSDRGTKYLIFFLYQRKPPLTDWSINAKLKRLELERN